MSAFRLLKPKFVLALFRNLAFKLRHRSAFDFDIFKTYIDSSALIEIVGGGKIVFERGKRIYISRGCVIRASGGILTIGQGAFFNQNCVVVSHQSVSVQADSMFGPNVCVFDADHAHDDLSIPFSAQGYVKAPVTIGKNTWLGANVIVARGAGIGSNCIIGANAVVRGRIPDASVAVGAPARVVKRLDAKMDCHWGSAPLVATERGL
ncbi:acyltransferase [Niveibacterium microcysteis]|uniref:Acyltransferase n=1 Tax=Niveibacterium microcysteis TaxID=2811415 RepID=A0ABX7MBC8_9RHOO|nr:acyltransferase [Niveibacterium microcysteis]QSI79032.1 acyltransferase [Niveibacterium microcysteis]